MEPGHEDREYNCTPQYMRWLNDASMEPGHEDREYGEIMHHVGPHSGPQWSPVMKTGNTLVSAMTLAAQGEASMEPGHEDREYGPVLGCRRRVRAASMEPGHEDREYRLHHARHAAARLASMEPGHEDREYVGMLTAIRSDLAGLNGARS